MLTEKIKQALSLLSTPLIVDSMEELGLKEYLLEPEFRPIVPYSKIIGTAITVQIERTNKNEEANLNFLSKAYETTHNVRNPIISISVPDSLSKSSIFGSVASVRAQMNGFSGALIGGSVRDTQELMKSNFPIFSNSISPGRITGLASAKSTGEPIQIGGVNISQGNIVFADNDGVIILPESKLSNIVDLAFEINTWEGELKSFLTQGANYEQVIELIGKSPK
jgi:regulator of RNase E activity RraA